MTEPFFSVLVPAYNRAHELERCVGSCSAQTYPDFEIVVVDDGSDDDTRGVLTRLREPRLKIVHHDRNRGISPARATAVAHSRGEWLVTLDSDWELVPHALARLRELTAELPRDVLIIRSRLRGDDGELQPGVLPAGVTGYRERLEWCAAVSDKGVASDAGQCIHRSVVAAEPFIADRRGGVETLWELNVARWARSLWVPDVLGIQHADAANSHTRDVDPARLIPRLLAEAPDTLAIVETLLAEHHEGLAQFAPTWRLNLQKSAGLQAFLTGDRAAGVRHTLAAMDGRWGREPKVWATLVLGLIGPRALAYAQLAERRRRARTRR